MWRKTSVFLAVFALLFFNTAPALACSCVHYGSARAHLRQTDLVFIGIVQSTERIAQGDMRTTFLVSETLKGEARRTMVILHNDGAGGMCGIMFAPGGRAMVFANERDGLFYTSACNAPRFDEARYRAALLPLPRESR
jgi:hypothetical protein